MHFHDGTTVAYLISDTLDVFNLNVLNDGYGTKAGSTSLMHAWFVRAYPEI